MTLPWRKVPSGRGLYDRGNPRLYTSVGGAAELAAMYGCKWFALELASATRVETALAARARGMRLWGWTWPSYWRPDSWRRGLEIIEQRGRELEVDGVIVDIEEWSSAGGWGQHPTELSRCLAAIGELAERMPVGLTTFPSWGGARGQQELRARAPGLTFVSPQCYGVRGGNTPQQTVEWARTWRANFPQPVIPSLAAWDYSPEEAVRYLRAWSSREWRGSVFWTTGGSSLWTDPARVEAINAMRFQPSPWLVAGGICATLGAVGLGAAVLRGGGV